VDKNEKRKKFLKKSGFTLVELLITIFLVSVGLIGSISFFNSSLQSQFDAKNEVIAAGLAQEATELVRNIVDYNFLKPQSWWNEIVANSNAANGCDLIDKYSLDNHKCKNTASGKKMNVCFDGQFYYQCPTGAPSHPVTIFRRKLEVVGENVNDTAGYQLEDGDCLEVTATVGWPNTNPDCNSNIISCPYKTVSTDIICKPRQ